MGLREQPALWAELVRIARDEVGEDWTEDEIAAVLGKVHAPSPDLLIDHIGHVLCWCAAAIRSGDEDAVATVSLWQHPTIPIVITVSESGEVSHRLDLTPDQIEVS